MDKQRERWKHDWAVKPIGRVISIKRSKKPESITARMAIDKRMNIG